MRCGDEAGQRQSRQPLIPSGFAYHGMAISHQVLPRNRGGRAAGLKIKINMVALKGVQRRRDRPDAALVRSDEGHDLTLIETMPLGEVEEDRTPLLLPLDAKLEQRLARASGWFRLFARHGWPRALFRGRWAGIRLGIITPLTNNFAPAATASASPRPAQSLAASDDQKVELRELLRAGGAATVDRALDELLAGKPERHQVPRLKLRAPPSPGTW